MLHQERGNNWLMDLVKGDLYLNSICSDFVPANKCLWSEPQSFEILGLADGSISASEKKDEKLLISVHTALRASLKDSVWSSWVFFFFSTGRYWLMEWRSAQEGLLIFSNHLNKIPWVANARTLEKNPFVLISLLIGRFLISHKSKMFSFLVTLIFILLYTHM